MRGGGGAGGNWRTTKATWNPAESGTYSRRQASDRFADRNSKFNKNRQLGTWEETEGAKAEYRRGLKVNDIVDTVGGYKAMILEVDKGGGEYRVKYEDPTYPVETIRSTQIQTPRYPITASDKLARVLQPNANNRAAMIHLFKYLDVSGDGRLGQDDIAAGDAEGGRHTRSSPPLAILLRASEADPTRMPVASGAAKFWTILEYDANGDREIDPDEFVDMFMTMTSTTWNNGVLASYPALVGGSLQQIFQQLQVRCHCKSPGLLSPVERALADSGNADVLGGADAPPLCASCALLVAPNTMTVLLWAVG